jgi:hypothetical protein
VALTAEWRTNGENDAVLIVDDETVREVVPANPEVLSKLLTETGDLEAWRGGQSVASEQRRPSAWGHLVIARAGTGEVLDMDPERFWNGIYQWFRSRGVDYDTPRERGGSR